MKLSRAGCQHSSQKKRGKNSLIAGAALECEKEILTAARNAKWTG